MEVNHVRTLVPAAVEAVQRGAAAAQVTVQEFDRLGALGCFEGRRALLLDGVILQQGPMDPPHANALEVLTEAVRAVFEAGWRFRGQTPLHLDQFNNPMPDLAVVAGRPGYNQGHPTVAALVVEVSDSTLHTDLTAKAEWYATAGIVDGSCGIPGGLWAARAMLA
ncbi:Uma2 family endonuclease [Gemmata obscuriglobus]|uniref:Uma2 family endonuclease n=1 Tax=Gemmata obscuriglobus TaxID=114 RepID=UPI00016C35BD|nr:Uma2 family endonuclease [Gemmata obscuriglobus]